MRTIELYKTRGNLKGKIIVQSNITLFYPHLFSYIYEAYYDNFIPNEESWNYNRSHNGKKNNESK